MAVTDARRPGRATVALAAVPATAGAATPASRPPRERGDRTTSFLLTLIAVVALAAFLSPMLRSVTVRDQEHRPDHPGRARRSTRPTR